MLRLSEAPLSSRFGGWTLTESPRQRTATYGQQWSLVIAIAAALVSMSAVLFDVRLSSDVSMPVVISPPPSSIETTERAATEVAPAATEVRQSESTQTAALVAPPQGSPTTAGAERTAQTAPDSAVAGEQSRASAASVTETNASAAASIEAVAETDASTEAASAATVDDPASRIRDYLGLHAGAQLPVSFAYEVQSGDTASSIAKLFGLEEATVLFNNFDIYDANHLTVGQTLTLPPVDGLVYTVQPGDHLDFLLENYQADLEATLGFAANGISSPDQIQAGQRLLLVHGSASVAGASTTATSGNGGGQAAVWTVPTFVWPLGYDKISDLFGTPRANSVGYHTGVDFVAAVGTIVGSTAAGQVTVATWDPSYGNWIEIDHGGGYRSRYAHLDEIWVREGEWLQSNAYIGTVGNTGNSSGAHLHFEIIINGQAVNPLAWLN